MTLTFLVGFATCSSFGLVLSGVLMYIDTKGQTEHGLLRHDYRWERALALLFEILQMCLSIAGIVEAVAVFHYRREGCSWLETGVVCSLQLAVGTNVRTSVSFIQQC
jgi:hypothetical protein